MSKPAISQQTQKNWWIDVTLFIGGALAALSGLYFLFLPSGGYQGGRNPFYNIQILFTRHTWDDIHTWSGVIMISIALIHLGIHWSWVVNMTRRSFKELTGQCGCMNPRGRWNLILNTVVAISFVVTALSGAYFLFNPGGRWAADPMLLFSRNTWDLIHTWGGVVLIAAVLIHFAIHWKWITKVTRKMITMIFPTTLVPQPMSKAEK